MSILSEGKGVDDWLHYRKIQPQSFRQFIVNKSPESFYKISYNVSKKSSDKFQRFVLWFLNQDLEDLRIDWRVWEKERSLQKAQKKEKFKKDLLIEYNEVKFDEAVELFRGKSKNQFVKHLKSRGVSYKRINKMIEIWKEKHL